MQRKASRGLGQSWKRDVRKLVLSYCARKGQRTFALQPFTRFAKPSLAQAHPRNLKIDEKIRQTLQFLRNDKLLIFVDDRGTYTCCDDRLRIAGELTSNAVKKIDAAIGKRDPLTSNAPPRQRREYISEVFARNPAWMRKAKKFFGHHCMMDDCRLTFRKPDGTHYIEVHHIKPLCENGENEIWNLATVCAHHHRMAHFANQKSKRHVHDILMRANEKRLDAFKRGR